ncbi:MAG: hypothetical protein ACLTWR_03140 [Agathobaculum desmolans]|uniref:hypothetical protein n=1 Tax=Agathobaculum desmolans TaxID=39484 RepID=UPI003992EAE9
MKKTMIAALLGAVLCVSAVMPAGAAQQPEPAELTVREMGLRGVAAAVEKNNPTVQALRKTAAGIDTASAVSAQFAQQGVMLGAQIAMYQSLIGGLEQAMEAAGKDQADLKAVYQAHIALLTAQSAGLEQVRDGLPAQEQAAVSQIEDAVYQLEKQADYVADQITQGAQTLLLTIRSLQYTGEQLDRQLAAVDRSMAVLEVQQQIGMAGALQVETARRQRDNLAMNADMLDGQIETLGNSLALLCGMDAASAVLPAALGKVSEAELRAMDLEKDLAAARKSSFIVWQKRDALRQAQNTYDKDIESTVHAVQAAEAALDAAQEELRARFTTLFRTVQDKKTAVQAARTAAEQAARTLHTSEVKYRQGMISRLAYQQAQDEAASAAQAVETAELELLTAYQQYQWGRQGLVSAAG